MPGAGNVLRGISGFARRNALRTGGAGLVVGAGLGAYSADPGNRLYGAAIGAGIGGLGGYAGMRAIGAGTSAARFGAAGSAARQRMARLNTAGVKPMSKSWGRNELAKRNFRYGPVQQSAMRSSLLQEGVRGVRTRMVNAKNRLYRIFKPEAPMVKAMNDLRGDLRRVAGKPLGWHPGTASLGPAPNARIMENTKGDLAWHPRVAGKAKPGRAPAGMSPLERFKNYYAP